MLVGRNRPAEKLSSVQRFIEHGLLALDTMTSLDHSLHPYLEPAATAASQSYDDSQGEPAGAKFFESIEGDSTNVMENEPLSQPHSHWPPLKPRNFPKGQCTLSCQCTVHVGGEANRRGLQDPGKCSLQAVGQGRVSCWGDYRDRRVCS